MTIQPSKHGQSHYGKGSRTRPTNHAKFSDNWDKIFDKKVLTDNNKTDTLSQSSDNSSVG